MVSKPTPSTKPATEKTSVWRHLTNAPTYIQRQWHTLALVALYIFFRPTIESKLGALFLDFNKNEDAFYCCIALGIIAVIYAILLGAKGYVLNNRIWLYFFAVLVGWYRYRFLPIENYQIAEIPIEKSIYYIDFLLVICFCILIVSWLRCLRKYLNKYWHKCLSLFCTSEQATPSPSIEGYIVDYPASPEDADLLGRSSEVLDLAKKIFHTDTSRAAFTLGLTAPWGAGKTSFMLAMQKYLRDNHCSEIILIEFNPWMYRKAPNLTQSFFEELSRALAPYSSALASGFMQYVEYILSKENNTWIQLGARLLPQGFKAKSTSEQYEFLNKEIGKLGKKIIIFIDDVDRLDGEELIELFSLIRNSSLSFPHMSYILAYDKEYVASQLQSKFNEHTYRYMEKILQEEYPLAKITPEQLEEVLRLELKRIGYGDLWRDIKNSGLQLSYHLPTLRVIKRICNTLSSRRKELEGNVALFDWLIIELIRIQYPRVFDLLRVNYKRIFKIGGDRYVVDILEKGEEQNSSATAPLPDHPLYGGIIHPSRYLSEHQDSLQIKNVGLVIELIGLIWGTTRKVAPLQANHSDYIERYFYGTLRECEIDETEFREHVNLSFEEIKAYIQQKRVSQITDLIQKVRREPAESQEKAQILLQILLYLFSDPSRLFRIDQVTEKVDSLKKYLKEASLKSIFKEIFEHPDTSVGALRYLSCIAGDEDNVNKLPFTQDEIETIKETLFLRYLEESKPLDLITCYNLWRLAHINTGTQPNVGMCHTKMDEKMKQIIVENIESFIPIFIEQYREDERRYKLLYPKAIWNLDADRKNPAIGYFPEFIFGLDGDSSPIIREFQEFLRKRLESEEPLITFEFKYITPANVWWKKSS